MTILGSLVLHATRDIPQLPIPELQGLQSRTGRHVSARYNGSFAEFYDVPPTEILVPQRYKRMSAIVDNPEVRSDIAIDLSTLDSQYEGCRQLYKLRQLMDRYPVAYTAIINTVNTNAEDEPQSGAFCLLASRIPLYISMVFDSSNGSVQLVWSDFNHRQSLRAAKAFNYSIYAMPTLLDQPLFITALSLCSRWWQLSKDLSKHQYGFLRACNALELNLYKDPYKKYAK